MTIAFFTLGMIVMLRFAANTAPLLFMATALAVFFGQLIFLLVVILLLQNAEWLDGTAFGLTALAVALVWQVFQIIGYLRTRRLVYDETIPEGEVAGEASTRHTVMSGPVPSETEPGDLTPLPSARTLATPGRRRRRCGMPCPMSWRGRSCSVCPAYVVDRLLGTNWIVLPGVLVGMAVSLYLVWVRYGSD